MRILLFGLFGLLTNYYICDIINIFIIYKFNFVCYPTDARNPTAGSPKHPKPAKGGSGWP